MKKKNTKNKVALQLTHAKNGKSKITLVGSCLLPDFFLFFSSFTLNSHFSVRMSFFQVSIFISQHFQILRMTPMQT